MGLFDRFKKNNKIINTNMQDEKIIDEAIFVCEDVDPDYDYSEKFSEVVDKIAEYFEEKMNISFDKKQCELQAIDIYDCNDILYVAPIKNSEYKMVIKVPLDQFQIYIKNAKDKPVIGGYCEIDYNQYTQENLNSMKKIVIEFEKQLTELMME